MQTLRSLRLVCAAHRLHNTAVNPHLHSAVHRGQLTLHRGDVCNIIKGAESRRSAGSGARSCWSCGARAHTFFCSACKLIQPPDDKTSYFDIFNCDHAFALDPQKLQQKYVELQRSLHPDNFSQKSLAEQEYSEMQSALVNKAYRTLQKPLTRAVYMLELQGVLLEEGTDPSTDPAFLLEIMEVNEKLAEKLSHQEVDAIGQTIRETLKDLTERMNTSLNKGELQSAKELLVRMKYFTNLEEKVKEKLRECL